MITTGAELVSAGLEPRGAQIRDSNGPMLVAMLVAMGVACPVRAHASDQAEAILRALDDARGCDLVLLSGGVSAGTYDLVPGAVERYGAEVVFHKVRQKPGKPLLLARKGHQLLFELPGNPLAAHLCLERYVRLAILRMEGCTDLPARSWGRLTARVWPKAGRTYFVTARCEPPGDASEVWRLAPLIGASSADVFNTCNANGYIVVPPGREEHAPGELLEFFMTCTL